MPATEFTDLRQSIGQLRQCIDGLHTHYGDASSIRRLANDLDRLKIDADELESSPPTPAHRHAAGPEVIYVPDSRSDESAWMGAQDEGLGFHSRERTR